MSPPRVAADRIAETVAGSSSTERQAEIESIADDRSAGSPEASIARTRATAAASHTAPRVVRIPTRVESVAALRKARPVGKTPQR